MKKLFLLIFAVLLVLGSALPLAAYRVTRAVQREVGGKRGVVPRNRPPRR